MRADSDLETDIERPGPVNQKTFKVVATGVMGILALYAASGAGAILVVALTALGAAAGWLVADLAGDMRSDQLSLRHIEDGQLRIDGVDHTVEEHPAVVIEERVISGHDNNRHNEFDVYWEPNRPPELDGPDPASSDTEVAGMVETVTLVERADSPKATYSFARRVARATDSDLVWSQRDATHRWSRNQLDMPLLERLDAADAPDWEALETADESVDIQPRSNSGVTIEWHSRYRRARNILGIGLICGIVLGIVVATDANVYWLRGILMGLGIGVGFGLVPAAAVAAVRRHRGHRLEIDPDGIHTHYHRYGILPATEEFDPGDIHHLRVERHLDDGVQLEVFGDDLYSILGRRAHDSAPPLREVALCGLLGRAGANRHDARW